MAHGNSRICICYKCNMYGLITRFNQNICPNCNNGVKTITNEELKKKLNLMIHENINNLSFTWKKIKP